MTDPERTERTGEALGAGTDLSEGRFAIAILEDGDDLGRRMDGLAVGQDVADQQRRLLHRALEHLGSPLLSNGAFGATWYLPAPLRPTVVPSWLWHDAG